MYTRDGLHSVFEVIKGVVLFALICSFLGRCALFDDVAIYFDCFVYLDAILEEFIIIGSAFVGWGSKTWAFYEDGTFFYLFVASYALSILAVAAL